MTTTTLFFVAITRARSARAPSLRRREADKRRSAAGQPPSTGAAALVSPVKRVLRIVTRIANAHLSQWLPDTHRRVGPAAHCIQPPGSRLRAAPLLPTTSCTKRFAILFNLNPAQPSRKRNGMHSPPLPATPSPTVQTVRRLRAALSAHCTCVCFPLPSNFPYPLCVSPRRVGSMWCVRNAFGSTCPIFSTHCKRCILFCSAAEKRDASPAPTSYSFCDIKRDPRQLPLFSNPSHQPPAPIPTWKHCTTIKQRPVSLSQLIIRTLYWLFSLYFKPCRPNCSKAFVLPVFSQSFLYPLHYRPPLPKTPPAFANASPCKTTWRTSATLT